MSFKKKLVGGVVLTGMTLGLGASAASAQGVAHVHFTDEEAGSFVNFGDGYIQGPGHSDNPVKSEGTVPLPALGLLGGVFSGAVSLGEAAVEIVIQVGKDLVKDGVKSAVEAIHSAPQPGSPSGPVDGGVPGGVPLDPGIIPFPDKSKDTTPPPPKEETPTDKTINDTSKSGSDTNDKIDSSKADKDGEPPEDCTPNCPPTGEYPNPDGDGPSGPAVHVPLDRVTQPTIDGGGPTGPATRFGSGIAEQPTIDGGGPEGPAFGVIQ
ncbi:MAG: hypothetical protein QOI95_1100 [Acidimicrobiaceae bacterium]|jgi:hypothetical protein